MSFFAVSDLYIHKGKKIRRVKEFKKNFFEGKKLEKFFSQFFKLT